MLIKKISKESSFGRVRLTTNYGLFSKVLLDF